MIIKKIRPRVPPITLFQPLSSDFLDNLTQTETLLGLLKKLNEAIVQINSNTEFIDSYTGKIEEIEIEIAQLRQDYTEFTETITEDINSRFQAILADLNKQLAILTAAANAYTDTKIAQVEAEIQQIILGAIDVYDPTTGVLSPLQTVLNNLYDAGRDNALTATEYDSLELTATAYDGYEITAFNYDQSGKEILMPTQGE